MLGHAPGGILGEYFGGLFLSLLSFVGSLIIVMIGIVLALIEVVGFSPAKVARWIERVITVVASNVGRTLQRRLGVIGRALLSIGRWLGGVLLAEAQEFAASLRDPMPGQTSAETIADDSVSDGAAAVEPPIVNTKNSHCADERRSCRFQD